MPRYKVKIDYEEIIFFGIPATENYIAEKQALKLLEKFNTTLDLPGYLRPGEDMATFLLTGKGNKRYKHLSTKHQGCADYLAGKKMQIIQWVGQEEVQNTKVMVEPAPLNTYHKWEIEDQKPWGKVWKNVNKKEWD